MVPSCTVSDWLERRSRHPDQSFPTITLEDSSTNHADAQKEQFIRDFKSIESNDDEQKATGVILSSSI